MEQSVLINGKHKKVVYDEYKWGNSSKLPERIREYVPHNTNCKVRDYTKLKMIFIEYVDDSGQPKAKIRHDGEVIYGIYDKFSYMNPCGFNDKGYVTFVKKGLIKGKYETILYVLNTDLDVIHHERVDGVEGISTSPFALFNCVVKCEEGKSWLINPTGKICSDICEDIYLTLMPINDGKTTIKLLCFKNLDGTRNYAQNGDYTDLIYPKISPLETTKILSSITMRGTKAVYNTADSYVNTNVAINTRGN